MGIFTRKIGPVFLKEESDAGVFVEKMQALLSRADGEVKQKIEKQISLAKYGEIGEKNIAFELSNSGMDMYILHDIYLEINGLSAQIDYIVITRQKIYVIECKNLVGDIEIDNTGAFIRSYEFAGKRIKEGIYSPITQNQRHLQVMKEVRLSERMNFITRALVEKGFEEGYKPIVVLANPKTCLNAKYAKKELKDKVIRADQLIAYIKKINEASAVNTPDLKADDMLTLAQFFLSKNKPNHSDYAKKYEEMLAEVEARREENIMVDSEEAVTADLKMSQEDLIKRLKVFRLEQSRLENIKPYFIFNDAQMADLITKAPKSPEELLTVSGFGSVKAEKYGEKILAILKECKRK